MLDPERQALAAQTRDLIGLELASGLVKPNNFTSAIYIHKPFTYLYARQKIFEFALVDLNNAHLSVVAAHPYSLGATHRRPQDFVLLTPSVETPSVTDPG